ncbi:hypothetical protein NQ317_001149 [Molorchus minor]|uniref:Uncharacterized protein n=1 Tax=Molorchus minor TaxID=1323400 RepID=A0ABQ9IYT7_9CUCU|nr:hypothetical protein NQ317_001149 [Molorchus minor]
MGWFLALALIIGAIFFIISWVLPIMISWHFERKYKISVRIGKIGLPYLKLCDIHLSKNGFSIHIDEVGIKSSFLNSDLTKLVTLVVRDVRINKDLSTKATEELECKAIPKDLIDFRDNKVPYFITSFAQFMAVHVYNISAMLLRSGTPGYLIHATASELHLDGSILKNAKSLLVTMNLLDAETKVLRHAENQTKETRLAEFSFGISMETILVAQGPLSVEKLDVRMSHSSAVINGGFYNLAHDTRTKETSGIGKSYIYSSEDDILQRIWPIVPKNCSLHIDDTSLTGVKENSQIEYNASLKALALNYRSGQSEGKSILSGNSSVLFNFYISDLLLQNSREKLLELKHINVDAKLKNYIVNIYLQQNSLLLTYDHNIIHNWVSTNFPKNKQKSSALKLDSAINDGTPINLRIVKKRDSLFEKVLEKLCINFCAELCQVLAIVKLKDQNSSVGFNRIRLMLDQSQDKRGSTYNSYYANLLFRDRHWTMDFLVESLWWSFKNMESGH